MGDRLGHGDGWMPYDYIGSGVALDFWSLVKMERINTDRFVGQPGARDRPGRAFASIGPLEPFKAGTSLATGPASGGASTSKPTSQEGGRC